MHQREIQEKKRKRKLILPNPLFCNVQKKLKVLKVKPAVLHYNTHCCLCLTSIVDESTLGTNYTFENFAIHYHCFLLSHSLKKREVDSNGVRGIFLQDVVNVAQKSSSVVCAYCRRTGASTQCHTCSLPFHLPCGILNNSLTLFRNPPRTYCGNHQPTKTIQNMEKSNLSLQGTEMKVSEDIIPIHTALKGAKALIDSIVDYDKKHADSSGTADPNKKRTITAALQTAQILIDSVVISNQCEVTEVKSSKPTEVIDLSPDNNVAKRKRLTQVVNPIVKGDVDVPVKTDKDDSEVEVCDVVKEEPQKSISGNLSCVVCLEAVDAQYAAKMLMAPCCRQTFYHSKCLQVLYNLGAEQFSRFECPVCSNGDQYRTWVASHATSSPLRDDGVVAVDCNAETCLLSGIAGSSTSEDVPMEMLFCRQCQVRATHKLCAGQDDWTCVQCIMSSQEQDTCQSPVIQTSEKIDQQHFNGDGNVFRCNAENCHAGFTSLSSLRAHHSHKHITDKPYKCEMEGCNKSFTQRCALQLHIKRHFKIRPYLCDRCDLSFANNTLLISHKRTHTGERFFACDVENCGATYKTKQSLNIHKETHLGKKYPCHVASCTSSFSQMAALKRHVANCHDGEMYPCTFENCNATFAHFGSLTAHQKCHGQEVLNEPRKTGRKHYACDVGNCKATFKHRRSFINHKAAHTGKRFACKIANCTSSFTHPSNLKHHVESSHGDAIYSCDFGNCTALFNHKAYLRRHIKRNHGDSIYPCTFENCKESFTSLGLLKTHENSHKVEEVIISDDDMTSNVNHCVDDGNADADVKCLGSDEVIITDEIRTPTGEKRYVCNVGNCRATFKHRQSLKVHKDAHAGKKYECKIASCSASFNHPSNLKVHVKSSHGGETYSCHFENCTASFNHKSYLSRHLKRNHSSETYACRFENCNASFPRLGYLRNHEKCHRVENVIICDDEQNGCLDLEPQNSGIDLEAQNVSIDLEGQSDCFYSEPNVDSFDDNTQNHNFDSSTQNDCLDADLLTQDGCIDVNIQNGGFDVDCSNDCRDMEPGSDGMFTCKYDNCYSVYTTRYNLKEHVRRVHIDRKIYKCNEEYCNVEFTRLDLLRQHERIHTGEMAHTCDYGGCNQAFIDISSLREHEKSHLRAVEL